MEVNSKEYWDYRFDNDWEERNGKEQTTGFMELLIQNLPQNVLEYMNQSIAVLDWGCAEGQGVDTLAKTFPNAKVSGLDISEVAIEKCKNIYPDYNFNCGCLNETDKYDVIITSNCLEHFSDPYYWMRESLECVNKYYIILVPYNQVLIQEESFEHKFSFVESSFPDEFNGFTKTYEKVIENCEPHWTEGQLLVVYEKK